MLCRNIQLVRWIKHCEPNSGSVDSVRTLLSSGVNPCVQNDANRTAYQTAETDEIRNAFVQELLQATAQSRCFFFLRKAS